MTISPPDQNGEQTQVYRAGRGDEELVLRQVVLQSELVQHAVEPLCERRVPPPLGGTQESGPAMLIARRDG